MEVEPGAEGPDNNDDACHKIFSSCYPERIIEALYCDK